MNGQSVSPGAWSLSGTGEWDEIAAAGVLPSNPRNILIEASVRGDAEAAGISFGPYKDFLAPVGRDTGERRLQFEIDADARHWVFRADGTLMERQWWDGAVHSVDDLLDGTLLFKARHAREVVFRDLVISRFESSCCISVVMTCRRFAQRLRVSLASWCRQRIPSGALEVIVVNPHSPDATHEVIASMACAYPEVRVRELLVDASLAHNKGAMLNRGIDASRGDCLWLTDADCIYPPDAVVRALEAVDTGAALFYGERRHLVRRATDSLLAGRLDVARDFDAVIAMTEEQPDFYPWGYGQIARRELMQRVRYREDIDGFGASDGAFLEACREAGVPFVPIDGLRCVHLAHPFAWNGTVAFL